MPKVRAASAGKLDVKSAEVVKIADAISSNPSILFARRISFSSSVVAARISAGYRPQRWWRSNSSHGHEFKTVSRWGS